MTRSQNLRLETLIIELGVKIKGNQEKEVDAQEKGYHKLADFHVTQIDFLESVLTDTQERYRLATIEKEYEQIEEYCDCCRMPDFVFDYGEYRCCRSCIDESK